MLAKEGGQCVKGGFDVGAALGAGGDGNGVEVACERKHALGADATLVGEIGLVGDEQFGGLNAFFPKQGVGLGAPATARVKRIQIDQREHHHHCGSATIV